jgi:transaldolase
VSRLDALRRSGVSIWLDSRRVAAGQPVDAIVSAASSFVSRVDTKADLIPPPGSPLRGQIAIANARIAYGRYRARFAEPRWQLLDLAGARPQRPLWASTGTKNPACSDVQYVEQLIAPDVINTMPQATMEAFADHGDPNQPPWTSDGAEETLQGAACAGVDLEAITATLEREGVEAFCRSYRELLDCIAAKVSRGKQTRAADPTRDQATTTGIIGPARVAR